MAVEYWWRDISGDRRITIELVPLLETGCSGGGGGGSSGEDTTTIVVVVVVVVHGREHL